MRLLGGDSSSCCLRPRSPSPAGSSVVHKCVLASFIRLYISTVLPDVRLSSRLAQLRPRASSCAMARIISLRRRAVRLLPPGAAPGLEATAARPKRDAHLARPRQRGAARAWPRPLPVTYTGTTGAPLSTASIPTPGLASRRTPSAPRVPSGNTSSARPSSSASSGVLERARRPRPPGAPAAR